MNRIALAAVAIAAVAIACLFGWIGHLNGANHALALRAYNDSAALDTSRALALSRKDSLRILGDSLGGATRLAVQRTQERDALDEALGQERRATVALRVTIAALEASAVPSIAPVVTDTATGERRAVFHVERDPFTVDAAVRLPAAGPGILDTLGVRLKPARLGVRIGCEPKNADGIRPARVTATGPTWLSISIDHAEQDDDVCQSVVAQSTSHLRSIFRSLAPQFYLGAGLSVNPIPMLQGKPANIQPAISAGVSFWHWPK